MSSGSQNRARALLQSLGEGRQLPHCTVDSAGAAATKTLGSVIIGERSSERLQRAANCCL